MADGQLEVRLYHDGNLLLGETPTVLLSSNERPGQLRLVNCDLAAFTRSSKCEVRAPFSIGSIPSIAIAKGAPFVFYSFDYVNFPYARTWEVQLVDGKTGAVLKRHRFVVDRISSGGVVTSTIPGGIEYRVDIGSGPPNWYRGLDYFSGTQVLPVGSYKLQSVVEGKVKDSVPFEIR